VTLSLERHSARMSKITNDGLTRFGTVALYIDLMNVYNVYKKFFVNAFIILSTFISIKIT